MLKKIPENSDVWADSAPYCMIWTFFKRAYENGDSVQAFDIFLA